MDVFQHKGLLTVDRTRSAGEVDEMRRRRLLQSWTLQQCWEDNLKHGTGGWSRSGHTDGLIKHFSLTKQKYCADRPKGDWVTIGQSSSQEQTHGLECLSWSNEDCVLLLMYKKPWWVSTPWSACRSVMVAEKTFWCWLFVWFFCAYVGVLLTAPGVIDPEEGLFLFHGNLLIIQHNISC